MIYHFQVSLAQEKQVLKFRFSGWIFKKKTWLENRNASKIHILSQEIYCTLKIKVEQG